MTKKTYMQPETVAVEMNENVSICAGSVGMSKDPAKEAPLSLGDEDRPVSVSWNGSEE